ncbi:hypothetical protein [Tenacibaculum sp. IB213877]|uniref:hypothetical protein n=1 Tax=Tenacibaculum sp. IB213877 TaxID=3097351 RepID=UPI002A5A8A9F|nr:hypothetical protein [Tenacibaculum sp. IB213877]MDY0779931.1 hypothetical protein [Tenacibaculum sp. IB213877]
MKKINLILAFFLILLLSCSENNDSQKFNLTDDTTGICDDPRLNDPEDGTICCIQRNSQLSIDSTVEYEYKTNIPNPSIKWTVVSGDINIVSDTNSNILVIEFGNNFNKGEINCVGESSEICTESVLIVKE